VDFDTFGKHILSDRNLKTHREAIDKVIENALTITAIDLFAFPMSVKSELL
jgi:hypothetical protein